MSSGEEEQGFYIANKYGTEQRLRRIRRSEEEYDEPAVNEEEIEEEEQVEEEAEDVRTFSDIQKDIFEEEDEDIVENLQDERDELMEEMENANIFEKDVIELGVLYRVRRSEWDEVYENLIAYSNDLEREVENRADFRRLPPELQERYRGVVRAAIRMEALRVRTEGLERRRVQEEQYEDYREFLKGHGATEQSLRRDQDRVRRGTMLFREAPVNLAGLVGQDVREKRQPWEDSSSSDRTAYLQQLRDEAREDREISRQLREQQKLEQEKLFKEELLRDRERWVDTAIYQDFYQRFQPGQEPQFFSRMDSRERRMQEDIWHLHRAAFIKRNVHFSPKDIAQNHELNSLQKDQMQRLYQVPGVRLMLEAYADSIINDTEIPLIDDTGRAITITDRLGREGQKRMSFWEMETTEDFNIFRNSLRVHTLRENEENLRNIAQETLKDVDADEDDNNKRTMLNTAIKQADAVAWDMLWVGNVVESLDSRYSKQGKISSLPVGVVVSDDLRAVFHPQEKFEAKCKAGHEDFGPLVRWGNYHIKRLMNKYKTTNVVFVPARNPGDYWKGKLIEGGRFRRGKRVIQIQAPECYPVTTVQSYWERSKIKVGSGRRGEEDVSFLDCLVRKEKLDFNEAEEWGVYNVTKVGKAVGVLDAYNGNVPLEVGKYGSGVVWSQSIKDLRARLNFEDLLPELRKEGKTYQTEHNLRVWQVMASTGGVHDFKKHRPKINLSSWQRSALAKGLRTIKYLGRTETLNVK